MAVIGLTPGADTSVVGPSDGATGCGCGGGAGVRTPPPHLPSPVRRRASADARHRTNRVRGENRGACGGAAGQAGSDDGGGEGDGIRGPVRGRALRRLRRMSDGAERHSAESIGDDENEVHRARATTGRCDGDIHHGKFLPSCAHMRVSGRDRCRMTEVGYGEPHRRDVHASISSCHTRPAHVRRSVSRPHPLSGP